MPIYTDFANAASTLMTTFGAAATLTRVTETYDEVLDETTETTQTSTILAVLGTRKVREEDGRLCTQTVMRSNSPLALHDRVALGTRSYRVDSVDEIAPIGTPLMYVAVVTQL